MYVKRLYFFIMSPFLKVYIQNTHKRAERRSNEEVTLTLFIIMILQEKRGFCQDYRTLSFSKRKVGKRKDEYMLLSVGRWCRAWRVHESARRGRGFCCTTSYHRQDRKFFSCLLQEAGEYLAILPPKGDGRQNGAAAHGKTKKFFASRLAGDGGS